MIKRKEKENKVLKKFNKFMWLSIGACCLFAIIGGILIFFPEVSINVIAYLVSFTLIICGFILIADYNGSFLLMNFLPTGILCVILGIVILLYPASFIVLVPIMVGIWMILSSIVNIELSITLIKAKYSEWMLPFLLSLVSMLCGILIIVNPQTGAIALTTALGILMIVYAITDVAGLIIFKSNVNEFAKVLDIKK